MKSKVQMQICIHATSHNEEKRAAATKGQRSALQQNGEEQHLLQRGKARQEKALGGADIPTRVQLGRVARAAPFRNAVIAERTFCTPCACTATDGGITMSWAKFTKNLSLWQAVAIGRTKES